MSLTTIDAALLGTQAQYTGMKSRIINGAMVIDQRNLGASQSITVAGGNTYTVDRWFAIASGATITGQQVAGSGNNQFNYRFTGAASVTGITFIQRIEQKNCYDLAGQTATLSVNFANSVLTTVTWTAKYAGSADNWLVADTTIASGTFTVSSTLTNFSTQISIPAAATTGLQVIFSVGAQTSGTWTIGQVQLEKGSTATSFDYRPYGTELALCQRYTLVDSNTSQPYRPFGNGTCANTTQAYVVRQLPVVMRATPSVTASASNVFLADVGGVANTTTAVTDNGFGSPSLVRVNVTASGFVAGQSLVLVSDGNSGLRTIIYSAEL